MDEYNIDELIGGLDFKSGEFNTCKNGLMFTNKEIDVLRRYDINYEACTSLKEIIFLVEDILNEDDGDCEDLEEISGTIAERDYYFNTEK